MEKLKYSFSPYTVFLEILHGCNLYCSYCYIGQKRNHIKPFVPSLETTLQILHILKKGNIEEIVLLGGEPTLSPHFADICHAIAELGFPRRGIVTNGTAMTLQRAQMLKDAGFWVDISFRGSDSDTFDAITDKAGSFKKACESALLLSKLGLSVGIEFDCIPDNYEWLYETIRMLIRDGIRIKQLQLHRILPEGDAEHGMDKFFLTLDQWQVVFEQAVRIRDELQVPVIFEDGFPFCLVPPEYREMIAPCPCGFTLLTIGPNGEARYCPCHRELLGNVLRDPLPLIWEQRLQDFRSLSRYASACLECDLLGACRGGCSASGNADMNTGMDVFQEYFHPIKLNSGITPNPKVIIEQSVRNYLDEEHMLTDRAIEHP